MAFSPIYLIDWINMSKNIKGLISILIGFAIGLLIYSKIKRDYLLKNSSSQQIETSKALTVKKIMLKYKKPERVEIETFTQKFKSDIEEIKRLKIPMDKSAKFYMQVQLFSDDSDNNAPLIVQIKFKDIKSNSLIKEESHNLE